MKRYLNVVPNYAGFFVALIAYACALYSPVLLVLHYDVDVRAFAIMLFVLLYLGSIIIIVTRFYKFDRHTESITKLLLLYFEMLFIFASVYLWLYLLGGDNQIAGFAQFDRTMLLSPDTFDFDLYKKQIWVLIVDSLHFSVVTGTTLGYGDMLPKHMISKLLVDAQVLLTFGVVVVGYGRYTSEHTKI